MNADDLARLELAKRAYRSTEPSAAEVQRGVRKARLGLQRPRARGTWLTKTIVACVLAMGGLAYAKPHALGELMPRALRAPAAAPGPVSPRGPAARPEPVKEPPAAVPQAAAPTVAEVSEPARVTSADAAATPKRASLTRSAITPPRKPVASVGSFPEAATEPQVSDWGRVGSALARGDEARALAVLSELAESDDRRTRDKADLGRAQLMMSNGNRDGACAIALSLTQRSAGSRIERQAQALLKGCAR